MVLHHWTYSKNIQRGLKFHLVILKIYSHKHTLTQKISHISETHAGNVGCAPTKIGSGAKSRTAIIDGVETDFCSGNLAGNNRNCSASRFALILLKSF